MAVVRWTLVVIWLWGAVGCTPPASSQGGTTPSAQGGAGPPPSAAVPPNWTPVQRRASPEPPPVRPVFVDPTTGIGFPPTAGGLRYRGVRRYRSAALGFSVRYQNTADTWADVFIYPGFGKKAPEQARSAAMARHFRQVEGDIFAAARQGYYRQLKKLGSRLLRLDGRELWQGRYTYALRGRLVGSLLYLTGYRGHYVKVRFTYVQTRRAAALREARGLLHALIRQLR